MEMYKKIEASSFTLFMDNLPKSMSTFWLWQLCSYDGRVVDVFISRKRRASNPLPFAFVRFSSKQDATNVKGRLDGIIIRGCALEVKEAKYRR